MKFKFLRVIPLLILIFCAYLLINNSNTSIEFEPVQIFSANLEDISGIAVSLNDAKNSFELIKNGEEWFFSDDKNLKVLQSKAHSLSYDVSHIFAERTVDRKGLNLQQYGLEPAVSIVSVKLNDGSLKEFHIGNRLDNGREYYFKTSDSPEVYTLYIGKGQMFTSNRQDFVDKKLSYITREKIKKITIYNSENEKTVIEKEFTDDGVYSWNVIEPVKWNVLESQLESQILYPLISLQAKEFDENENSVLEFKDKVKGSITVEMLNGAVSVFYFTEKNDDGLCYVMVDNYYPAITDTKLCNIVEFKPEVILNKRIAPQFIEKFNNITIVNGNKQILCYTSEDEQYYLNNSLVSEETYSRFVNNISELTCGDIIYADNLTPINTYIEYTADDTSIKFEFYKQSDELYAVTCDGKTFLEVGPYNFEQWINNTMIKGGRNDINE